MEVNTMDFIKKKPLSLEVIEEEGLNNLKDHLKGLYDLWREFGITEEQKTERGKKVWEHITDLMDAIITEEKSFYDDITNRIEKYTKKISELSEILKVSLKQDNSTSSLIKREENLRQELDCLTQLKHKRIKSLKDLRNIESTFCSLLGMKEHQISSSTGVPSENDLQEIEQHISMLRKERDRRYKKFCAVKRELATILEVTEFSPETQLEKDVLSSNETVSLTNETLKALEEAVSKAQNKKAEMENQKKELLDKLSALWDLLKVPDSKKTIFLSQHQDCKETTLKALRNELEQCEKIKRENIKMYVDNMREKLKKLWDDCFVSESERNNFCMYNTKDMSDALLVAHEAEVEKLKLYSEEIKSIAAKIKKRKELWDLLLVFENKASDPNRFKNRKGNLLKEEKERKKLQKDLPALENDIFFEIDMYESMYNKPFLYFGQDYKTFVTEQWQERINEKENQKIERQKQRLLQTETEVAMGTPGKRLLLNTPKSAPSKLFKNNNGMSIFRTPTVDKSRVNPCSTGKSVLTTNINLNSLKKSNVSCKLFSSAASRPKVMKKKDQPMVLRERNKSKITGDAANSSNTTTYSQFANELNSSSRRSFRSSVLATKKVRGTRISINSSKNKRKSASKTVRKSLRNVSKTATNLTPARGKLGLPFLI